MLHPLRGRIRIYVLISSLILTLAHLTQAESLPNKLFIFGDSFSDIGAGYVDGNGPTAFAYLAKDLDLQLTYPNDPDARGKSLDFAVSGAPTGLSDAKVIAGKILGLGITNQVQDFANLTRNGKITFVPSRTLFLLAGGLNDQHFSTGETVENLKDEIRVLAELGAVHIQVALLPESIPAFHDVSVRLNPAIARIPQELSIELPNMVIRLSRWGRYFDAVMSSPAKFGITNVKDRCAGRKIFDENDTPCSNPDHYFYYHASHPSTAVHKIIGDKLYLDLLTDESREDRDDPVTASLDPFWSTTRHTEPILPVQNDPAKPAHARLLFIPSNVYGAHSADGSTTYKEGQDFEVDKSTGIVTLTRGSHLPYRTKRQLFLSASEADHLFGPINPEISSGIFFSEGAIYEGFQTYIDYSFSPYSWQAYIPRFARKQLPRVLARLKGRENLHMLIIGDSISAGYSASSAIGVAPREPSYSVRVAAGLQRTYRADIFLHNISVPGWRASQGADQVQASHIADTHPDLVIIAFGMNDVGTHDPGAYRDSIQQIIRDIRTVSPETEFILVAPMVGNKDWPSTPVNQFALYRDQLASLTGTGVVMADMTAIWKGLLKRKTFFDLTGNGLNHPNDFGHRLYAQALLGLLVNNH